jgi:hypothetical protein
MNSHIQYRQEKNKRNAFYQGADALKVCNDAK